MAESQATALPPPAGATDLSSSDVAEVVCSACGQAIAVDNRYVTWCEHCGWNMDGGVEPEKDRKKLRRQEKAKQRGERLFQGLSHSDLERPGWSAARGASVLVAVLIHVVTLSILAGGAIIAVTNFPRPFAR